MQVITTYRYKLKPTKAQIKLFERWLGTCRFVYNLGMEIKRDTYRISTGRKSIGKYDLMKQLTEAKKDFDWLSNTHSQVLQNVLDRLDRSYKNFFEHRAGYPKFAKKDKYNSFTFKQGVKLCPNTFRVALPKIGKVRFFKDRLPDNMNMATATIIKEADGWFMSISGTKNKEPMPTANKNIGIDLGLKSFAVTSNGEFFDAPNCLRKAENKLKHLQKEVSRKKKGSNNRRKAVKQLAKAHKKVSETRKDFLHKLSTKLVRENQSISVENLNIRGMVKNHKLAKSISDAGWGMFKVMLKYKAEQNNRTFFEVNPRNTSKQCSVCGNINDDLKLSDREWTCSLCGTKHNRDGNAAVNILNKGFGLNLSTCGENVSRVITDTQFPMKQEPHTL